MRRPDADVLGHVFGKGFSAALDQPILVIGSDRYNRLDLADMGVTQLRAARIVSGLAHDVHARNTRDLYRRLSPASLAGHVGAGLHTLFVLWRAFEAKNLDASAWYWQGREGAIRTFLTLKHREARTAAQHKRRMPRRAQIALTEQKGSR